MVTSSRWAHSDDLDGGRRHDTRTGQGAGVGVVRHASRRARATPPSTPSGRRANSSTARASSHVAQARAAGLLLARRAALRAPDCAPAEVTSPTPRARHRRWRPRLPGGRRRVHRHRQARRTLRRPHRTGQIGAACNPHPPLLGVVSMGKSRGKVAVITGGTTGIGLAAALPKLSPGRPL
jgi:hypothetical protein